MKLFSQLGIVTLSATLCAAPAGAATDPNGYSAGTGNTIGTGEGNVAAGSDNIAAGKSLAVGWENTAYTGSLVAGSVNIMSADSYLGGLIGADNEMTSGASNSLLFGDTNSMGRQNASMAAGRNNQMIFPTGKTGSGNFALGVNNITNATGISGSALDESFLIGSANQTSDSLAWVFGGGNIGQYQTVTLGMWNQTVSNAALIVGNGTGDTSRNNALVVLKNGNASLQGSLTLAGSPAVTTSYLSTNQYLTKEFGTGADAASGAVVAIGNNAHANGTNSVAIGTYAAAGVGSIGLGEYGSASGASATAITSASASGDYAFGANYGEASGDMALAMMGAWAQGHASVSIGGYDWENAGGSNFALGDSGTAIGGVNNLAYGFSSFAAGNHSAAASAYSTAIGSMNTATTGSQYSWVETDTLFELGNGYEVRTSTNPSEANRSNAITTLKNGETTLTNKAWKLNVAGTGDPLEDPPATPTDNGGRALVVEGHTELKGKVIISEPQGDISMGIYE